MLNDMVISFLTDTSIIYFMTPINQWFVSGLATMSAFSDCYILIV